MDDLLSPLPPPMSLAIAHTPVLVRDRLHWLLRFDRRLAQLVERASEPLFAQLRLAWWRDILAKPAANRPHAEPLLAMLNELSEDSALLEAAKHLIDAAELGVADKEAKARTGRALAISIAFAAWSGADQKLAENLAISWAGQGGSALTSYPLIFRPVTILAMAEHMETGVAPAGPLGHGLRLSWHALTGR
jgi:15-cis-phytoene synthase